VSRVSNSGSPWGKASALRPGFRPAAECYPALTTVHVPRDHIGHTLFTSLAPDSNGATTVGKEFIIDPELVVRDSTGPARR